MSSAHRSTRPVVEGGGHSRAEEWRGRLFTRFLRTPAHRTKHLEEWLLKRSLRLRDVAAVNQAGIRYLLSPGDLVQRQILLHGAYEPETLALVLRLLAPGDTMVDVGAHVGQFALHASSRVGPSGTVVAFEPNPRTYQRLLHNIGLNAADNVVPVLGAVGERAGVAPMKLPPEGNWGMSRIASDGAADYSALAMPLTQVLESLQVRRVDVLKIDVEGVEELVLRSIDFESTLRPRHIFLEFIPELASHQGKSSSGLLTWLRSSGYELLDVAGRAFDGASELPEFNLWARDRR